MTLKLLLMKFKRFKLKKIRKAYRIFFPLEISEEALFEHKLEWNSKIISFKKVDLCYEVKTSLGLNVCFRSGNHSDYEVFEQIFNLEEYDIIKKIINLNLNKADSLTMIDAGANVGYTTLYLNHFFNNAKIVSIEPSKENALFFKKNVFHLNKSENVVFHEKALSHIPNMNFSISRKFRDGKDWSISTESNHHGNIKGVTINEIIEQNKFETLTFLKIDIEGAEQYIFEKGSDISFLNKTKIIAVEIHDEFDIRNMIYEKLKSHNFYLIESGELTIGINKDFL